MVQVLETKLGMKHNGRRETAGNGGRFLFATLVGCYCVTA